MGSGQKLLWPEWLLGGEQRVLWPGWLVESANHWERKKVLHLRWSQAPPLPWLRQGRRINPKGVVALVVVSLLTLSATTYKP